MSGQATHPRRVLITGASGNIGRNILPLLPKTWEVMSTDHSASTAAGIILDVTDIDACRRMFKNVDAVIHLAADPRPDATFDELLPANIIGAYMVAQAAIDCEVRRLVLASSLQAVYGYPLARQRRVDDIPSPMNVYGATKAWAEALGAWVANTSDTSVVAMRIGHFKETAPIISNGMRGEMTREPGAWLSPRDCAELVRAAVEAEGIKFVIANGISSNRYPGADYEETMRQLGYHPQDDSWAS